MFKTTRPKSKQCNEIQPYCSVMRVSQSQVISFAASPYRTKILPALLLYCDTMYCMVKILHRL